MPWRECYKVDERLRFVARLLDGEKMAVLCRKFDISRKTGYKLFARNAVRPRRTCRAGMTA
jgi:putative transposase